MNVLWDGRAATIIDVGHAHIGPHFRDPTRFVAFGRPAGGHYVQPTQAREAILAACVDDLTARTGCSLMRARFDRDIALGELAELALVIAQQLAQGRDDEGPELVQARRVAHRLDP